MTTIQKIHFFKNKIDIRNIFLSSVLITSIMPITGCTPDAECDIEAPHAHLYTNDDSFDKYMLGEKVNNGSWNRNDEFVKTTEEMERLIDFENKNGLYRISLNKEKIAEEIQGHEDIIEYRYSYIYLQPVPHIMSTGKVTTTYFTYIPIYAYSWTEDANHSELTGETRVVHYVYTGCKVIKNENGNFEVIESENVDSLDELDDDYIYVKENFYKKVNLENKESEVDYEDGPEEDKRLDEQEQKEYEKQLQKQI